MLSPRYIIPFIIILSFNCFSQPQFFVSSGTNLNVNNDRILYIDRDLNNEGAVIFDSSGELILDQGLDNTGGTLTLNDAILKLGSGTARADGDHDLIFSNSDDRVKFVEFSHNGTLDVLVTGGFLRIIETLTSFETSSLNDGTLDANDRIVLLSGTEPDYMNHDNTIDEYPHTAIVPESTGGIINGLRIQRYFPGNRAWRFLSSPVTSTASINDNWQEGVATPVLPSPPTPSDQSPYNPNPGYGTHITGGSTDDGFDQNESGNVSLFTYNNNATPNWDTYPNTNSENLVVGTNYYTLVRGDRAVDLQINDFNTEEPTILRSTGTIHIGPLDVNHTFPTDTYFVASNPYQAPVDMNAVKTTSSDSFSNNMWVWQPLANNDGQYAVITIDSGVNSIPGLSNANQILQPFQSVFLQAAITNPSVNFRENHKVDNTNLVDVFNEDTQNNFLRIGLYDINQIPFQDVAYDGLVILMDPNFDTSTNINDAEKFFNTEENIAIDYNDTFLTLDKRNFPTDLNEVVDLYMINLDQENYNLSIELNGYDNLPDGLFLWDKYLDTYTALSNGLIIPINFDQSIPATIDENRFAITFKAESLSTPETNFENQIIIYPNAFEEELSIRLGNDFVGEKVKFQIFDMLGKSIYSKEEYLDNNLLRLDNLNFSRGNYLLNVTSKNQNQTFKVVKK